MLHGLALSSGVEIAFNADVISVSPSLDHKGKYASSTTTAGYDPSKPLVTLATGEVYHADIIVGADGAGSIMREVVDGDAVVNDPASSSLTSMAFYTGTIPVETTRKDESLRDLVKCRSMIWMGDSCQAMSMTTLNIFFRRVYLPDERSSFYLTGYPLVNTFAINRAP